MPDMPEMFDRLTDKVGGWAEQSPTLDDGVFELRSNRELTAFDPHGIVSVTMADFKVTAIVHHDVPSHPEPSRVEVERATIAAINAVLHEYLTAELAESRSHALPMADVAAGLKELSADFAVAYRDAFARLEAAR